MQSVNETVARQLETARKGLIADAARKALNSKKLLLVPPFEKLAKSLLLVALCAFRNM